jgi:Ca2+-binding EF-hand superfamily protein
MMKTQVILVVLLAAGAAMAQEQDGRRGDRPQKQGGLLSRLDQDGDGKISFAEFTAPFADLDKNGDGFIDQVEMPKGPRGDRDGDRQGKRPDGQKGGMQEQRKDDRRGGGFMSRLDKNDDCKVSLDEFDGPPGMSEEDSRKLFTRLDKNGDGYISEDEAPAGPPPGRGGKGPGERP